MNKEISALKDPRVYCRAHHNLIILSGYLLIGRLCVSFIRLTISFIYSLLESSIVTSIKKAFGINSNRNLDE